MYSMRTSARSCFEYCVGRKTQDVYTVCIGSRPYAHLYTVSAYWSMCVLRRQIYDHPLAVEKKKLDESEFQRLSGISFLGHFTDKTLTTRTCSLADRIPR